MLAPKMKFGGIKLHQFILAQPCFAEASQCQAYQPWMILGFEFSSSSFPVIDKLTLHLNSPYQTHRSQFVTYTLCVEWQTTVIKIKTILFTEVLLKPKISIALATGTYAQCCLAVWILLPFPWNNEILVKHGSVSMMRVNVIVVMSKLRAVRLMEFTYSMGPFVWPNRGE